MHFWAVSEIQFSVGYIVGDQIKYDTQDYFEVEGHPAKLTSHSLDENVVRCKNSPLFYESVNVGRTSVQFTLANKTIDIPLCVAPVPVRIGMTGEEIIKALGMPDAKRHIAVGWPNIERVDGVTYAGPLEPGDLSGQGEHWKYKKFPGAVFVMHTAVETDKDKVVVEDRLERITSISPDEKWPEY